MREGFSGNGNLVDVIEVDRPKAPPFADTPVPFWVEIRLSDGKCRGRNSWFRAARAFVNTYKLSGLPEVTINAYGRRCDARMPPISIGLRRRDAEALGHALIAVATAPLAPQP